MTAFAQATFSNQPLVLMLIPEGKRVAIVAAATFAPFWDEGEPTAFFASSSFVIKGDWYEYGKMYSVEECTHLKEWLKRQHVQITDYGQAAVKGEKE
jgi:hypothetical protein